jgi:hypothetical protein
MSAFDWAPGNLLALKIPAHSEALRSGGEAFLTEAFRATGALAADNRVTRITQFEEIHGGSTGRKLFLSVAYERPGPPTDLFVKFSRALDDPARDSGKVQMESEVRFALLSRQPQFPIAVPACLYADYDLESGTGVLIAQRVAFGVDGIEPLHEKCLDYEIAAPLDHYRVIIRALARLAGTHKAGRFAPDLAQQFPFEPDKLAVARRAPFTAAQLKERAERYVKFAMEFPQLLPPNIRSAAFLARFAEEASRFAEHEAAINRFLNSKPEFIALCHWNAHIDNAWFWRNARGEMECGLMDWGNVSQMNVAMALWGALSGAELALWDDHLDELLRLFVAEFAACGGPPLDPGELKFHMLLYTAMMGLTWLLDATATVRKHVPELADIRDRFDPRFKTNERARAQTQIMTVFLNLWQTQDFGAVLDRFIARQT